jgi:hypothetical protein
MIFKVKQRITLSFNRQPTHHWKVEPRPYGSRSLATACDSQHWSPQMAISKDRISESWGITSGIGAGVGGGFVVGVGLVYLLNVKDQLIFPARMISAGAGAGVGIRGGSLGNGGRTFFRTSSPLSASDFEGFVTVANAEAILATSGVQLCYMTFWGVNHDPYWLDLAGFVGGVSVGASVTLLCSFVIHEPRKVIGDFIGPK